MNKQSLELHIETILPNLFKEIIMKIDATTFTKDGEYYLVKESTPERSTMYRVLARTEQEARHLFEVGSHLVTFVGSVNWR